MASDDLARAYAHCRQVANAHYENFTIGSRLLPRRLRDPLAAIYAALRTADDLADEGDRPPDERLRQLAAWERKLESCAAGRADDPIFVALADTIRRFALPLDPFRALLSAFRQDAEGVAMETDDDLLSYCRRSAAPVGHLVLALFGHRDRERQALADDICIGLQLANFWQDLGVDLARGRRYLPAATLAAHGIDPSSVTGEAVMSAPLRAVIRTEVARARQLLNAGLPLADRVERPLALEVRLFAGGGLAILDRIAGQDYDVLARRPTVSGGDRLRLLAGACTRTLQPRPARRPARPGRDATLAEAYAYCQTVTQHSSSNFAYAFRLLDAPRRDALTAVYAFCRFVDDVADDAGRADPSGLLGRWREELERVYAGVPTHPIGRALADAARRFPLERRHFLDLIDGVELDLTRQRYATFEELHRYCYLVASTVGLLCIEIFGHRDDSARDYAIDLGVAFQLTNILRDVDEDARRGRLYLPLEDLRHFGCAESDLLRGPYSPRVGALLAFECGRARAFYLRAGGALSAADRVSLAPAEAMRMIYERLLSRIEARQFDVFRPAKVALPRYEKVTLALAAWGRAQLAGLSG